MKQVIKILWLVIFMPMIIITKYQDVHNELKFERFLNQYKFCIVCFAPSKGTELQKEEFKNLKNRMQSASRRDDFKLLRKDVGFFIIDTTSSKIQNLSDTYNVSDFPTCLLFEDGSLVGSSMFDPKSTSDIIKFLDKNIGNQLDDLIEDRKKDARLDREERILSYYQYASSPWINPPYPWIPYSYYPYSRWGNQYGLGWNYDC